MASSSNCLLCGVQLLRITDFQQINSPRRIDLVQEKQWKHHKKAKLKHVMVPSKEVEEAEFAKYPNMWTCMCRASEFYIVAP